MFQVVACLRIAMIIAQDCRSKGSSYRNVKVWQLRVPSSGSSTLVHTLREFKAQTASDCVRHSSCAREGEGDCGRLRFASPHGFARQSRLPDAGERRPLEAVDGDGAQVQPGASTLRELPREPGPE